MIVVISTTNIGKTFHVQYGARILDECTAMDKRPGRRLILVAKRFLVFLYHIPISVMPRYDFKRFHIRSMNAGSDQERAEINQELKDLYASLPDDEKKIFNEELQHFLTHEVARIKSDYESVNGLNRPN